MKPVLSFFILCLSLALPLSAQIAPKNYPNIVVILADDLGYGSVNCYGAPEELVRTPNIDQLAKDGIRFTDASTPASVCSPTRYALLTGRYAWRTRLKASVVNPNDPLLIEEGTTTLPQYLQEHGYATAHVGKWHLGYTRELVNNFAAQPLTPGPNDVGFDYHFGVPGNLDDGAKVYIENDHIWGLRSQKISQYGRNFYGGYYHGYDAPQRITEQVMQKSNDVAIDWMRDVKSENPDRPFFLLLAQVAVHHPITPSEKMRGTSDAGAYGDFIHDVDESVRQIVEYLEKSGELDNTLLIFTSDNGGDVGRLGSPEKQAMALGLKLNGEFQGDKHTIYEGGTRVPFIVRWPDVVTPGVVSDSMINLVDVFATIQDLLTGKIATGPLMAPDSFSFSQILKEPGTIHNARPHMVTNSVLGVVAVRQGPWKYIEGKPATNSKQLLEWFGREAHPQLYNIEHDPSESKNLINEYPEVRVDMQKLLDEIRIKNSERVVGEY